MRNVELKIKKLFAAICAAGLLMTGCGGEQVDKDPNSQGTIIKLGMIAHLNAGEKQMEEYLFKVQEKTRAKVTNHVPVFYDSNHRFALGAHLCRAFVILIHTNHGDVFFVSTVIRVDHGSAAVRTITDSNSSFGVFQSRLLLKYSSSKVCVLRKLQRLVSVNSRDRYPHNVPYPRCRNVESTLSFWYQSREL